MEAVAGHQLIIRGTSETRVSMVEARGGARVEVMVAAAVVARVEVAVAAASARVARVERAPSVSLTRSNSAPTSWEQGAWVTGWPGDWVTG